MKFLRFEALTNRQTVRFYLLFVFGTHTRLIGLALYPFLMFFNLSIIKYFCSSFEKIILSTPAVFFPLFEITFLTAIARALNEVKMLLIINLHSAWFCSFKALYRFACIAFKLSCARFQSIRFHFDNFLFSIARFPLSVFMIDFITY